MAVTSSVILNTGLEKVAKILGNVSAPDPANYLGMGVGDDNTAADATQVGLIGNAIYVTVAPTYEADYIVVFNHDFTYAEITGVLTANTIKEYCITKNNTEYASGDVFMRGVVDPVVLGSGEHYDCTEQVEVKETT